MAERRRYSYPRDSGEIAHCCSQFGSSNQQSFSSTLLDAIYREIDRGEEDNEIGVYRQKKAVADEKVAVPAVDVKKLRKGGENLSSGAADCGGGESFPIRRPKAVRTGGIGFEINCDREVNNREIRRGFGRDGSEEKAKHEGGFLKTKSRALKIYGELKKVKQPISPGGKLAGLWNSLISTAGSLKKPKLGGADDSPSLKSTTNTSSTCSSASSFSRSCLSKTPSSRGKSSGGEKRSVRFFPVSIIVDEDCQPCGHKALHQENSIKTAIDDDLMIQIMNYQKKSENRSQIKSPYRQLIKPHANKQGFDHHHHHDEEFDGSSDSSSDLFELDNLSAVGMDQRYGVELPVYETTDLRTNRAIANNFIF